MILKLWLLKDVQPNVVSQWDSVHTPQHWTHLDTKWAGGWLTALFRVAPGNPDSAWGWGHAHREGRWCGRLGEKRCTRHWWHCSVSMCVCNVGVISVCVGVCNVGVISVCGVCNVGGHQCVCVCVQCGGHQWVCVCVQCGGSSVWVCVWVCGCAMWGVYTLLENHIKWQLTHT